MWPFKSKKQKERERRQNGFTYAAVELLKGKNPMDLNAQIECSLHFGNFDHFDQGMLDALELWKKKTGEEYDYMESCHVPNK